MNREELHRRVKLLKKHLDEDKMQFAPHLVDDFQKSIKNIRYASDGLVDPDSVDSRIRATLTMIAFEEDREEWKNVVSLPDIQQAYFQHIEHAFAQAFKMMTEGNAEPYQYAGWYTSDESRVVDFVQYIDEFVEHILEFWNNISEPTWIHLEDSRSSKAVFAGELFPDGNVNLTSSTGIYFDTTILPDPFVKISPLLKLMNDKERCCEVLRLGLQVLQYKELALAETSEPIVAILPDKHHYEPSYHDFLLSTAEHDTIIHASSLFDREFDNVDDLRGFLGSFSDPNSLVSELKRPNELLFATEWEGDLANQIMRSIDEQPGKLPIETPGDAVFYHLFGRFAQSNDAFQRSHSLNGTPIIRAETSWMWYNWMLRNNSNPTDQEGRVPLHIARALETTVQNEISWFGNIPPAALIEIRKTDVLDEIRGILGRGVEKLVHANSDNFFRTGDQVFDNLQAAIEEHQRKIKELKSRKLKFAGQDIGSFLVVGGIELTAAITGLPLYGSLAVTASMSGVVPTVKELKEKSKELKEEQAKVNNTGIGILFKHKK